MHAITMLRLRSLISLPYVIGAAVACTCLRKQQSSACSLQKFSPRPHAHLHGHLKLHLLKANVMFFTTPKIFLNVGNLNHIHHKLVK